MAITVTQPSKWNPINWFKRGGVNYTNIQLDLFERAARGDLSGALGVVEGCTGHWARGFSSAEVTATFPFQPAITRSMLYQVGRDLALHGESVWWINSSAGRFEILPADSNDIIGSSPDPLRWVYRLSLQGPSSNQTVNVSGQDVLHFRINSPKGRPWQGQSPMAITEQSVAQALNSYLVNELCKVNRNILCLLYTSPSPRDS